MQCEGKEEKRPIPHKKMPLYKLAKTETKKNHPKQNNKAPTTCRYGSTCSCFMDMPTDIVDKTPCIVRSIYNTLW